MVRNGQLCDRGRLFRCGTSPIRDLPYIAIRSGQRNDGITLWDFRKREKVSALVGHTRPIAQMSFSTDGRFLASGTSDIEGIPPPDGTIQAAKPSDGHTEVRIWDVRLGTTLLSLPGHVSPVTALAFAPCGSLLATADGNGAIKLWDFKAFIAGKKNIPRAVRGAVRVSP